MTPHRDPAANAIAALAAAHDAAWKRHHVQWAAGGPARAQCVPDFRDAALAVDAAWSAQLGAVGPDARIAALLACENPRVRDREAQCEVPLTTYAAFQTPRAQDVGLFRKVLGGISCREYEAAAEEQRVHALRAGKGRDGSRERLLSGQRGHGSGLWRHERWAVVGGLGCGTLPHIVRAPWGRDYCCTIGTLSGPGRVRCDSSKRRRPYWRPHHTTRSQRDTMSAAPAGQRMPQTNRSRKSSNRPRI